MVAKEKSFEAKKHESMAIARQLCYKDVYIKKLEQAKTEGELYRILKDARLDE